uniref:DUF1565 domain-containing protein n=1 Tax=Anisakis simplex TaxID=6269 RepID=A0A0M3JPD2_ANISI
LIAPESTRIFDMPDVHDYRCDNPRTNTVSSVKLYNRSF